MIEGYFLSMYYGILAEKQDGGCTEDSIDARSNVVGNSCNLVTESNKPLIHRDNPLRKVNLTFKRGFIVLKLVKNSAVIHLPLDRVLDFETCRRFAGNEENFNLKVPIIAKLFVYFEKRFQFSWGSKEKTGRNPDK